MLVELEKSMLDFCNSYSPNMGALRTLPALNTIIVLGHLSPEHSFYSNTKAEVHLKSTINNFLLNPSPLETAWIQEAQMLPSLNPNISLKLLHKLLVHNIITLDQITLPNGITLMNQDEFKIYHSTSSTFIQSALNIATQYSATLFVINALYHANNIIHQNPSKTNT